MTAAEAHVLTPPAVTVEPVRGPTRRWEARRRAILASAVAEMNRNGLRGMTLGEVAARLKLVPTGVIYYFRNKDDLASACLLAAIARFEELAAAAVRGAAGPRARLEGFLEGYFAFKQEAAGGQAEDIAAFHDVRALDSPQVNGAYEAMFRRVRELMDEPGGLRPPYPHRSARTHLLLAETSCAAAWLRRVEPADYGRAGRRLASILCDGLAAPGVAWPQPRRLRLRCGGQPSADAPAEQFLRAATELINAEGYHGASVERISARLNVSKGAFYHHNQTKDELVLACFQRTFDRMWQAIRDAEAGGGSGLEVLASLSTGLVELQLDGSTALVRTSALAIVPATIQPRLAASLARLSHRLASILCDGIADGSIRPVDVNIAAQAIFAMISAAAELPPIVPGLEPGAAADLFVRPLFQGLLSPAV